MERDDYIDYINRIKNRKKPTRELMLYGFSTVVAILIYLGYFVLIFFGFLFVAGVLSWMVSDCSRGYDDIKIFNYEERQKLNLNIFPYPSDKRENCVVKFKDDDGKVILLDLAKDISMMNKCPHNKGVAIETVTGDRFFTSNPSIDTNIKLCVSKHNKE